LRYERKYEFNIQDKKILEGLLLCQKFKEAFPKRNVNSIYYDDDDFSLFRDAEYGISNRQKIRIRFYDDGKSGLNLEKKNRQGEFNWKDFEEINYNDDSNILNLSTKYINHLEKNIIIPKTLNIKFKPKIIVSYERNYFVSSDGFLRATLDNNIKYLDINPNSDNLEFRRMRYLEHAILEIKYDSNYSPEIKIIEAIVDKLNLILSRSSKYCKGISLLYNI